ncbi:MAG: hypothetical protein H6625_03565 [Bdellovibrionaceae bacterium]|nr:hypothetical protein [Pseudobdellovibrionaceae bacterium]
MKLYLSSLVLLVPFRFCLADYSNCQYSEFSKKVGRPGHNEVSSHNISIEVQGCEPNSNSDKFCSAIVTCDGGVMELAVCKAIKNGLKYNCPAPKDCISETNKISSVAQIKNKWQSDDEEEEIE